MRHIEVKRMLKTILIIDDDEAIREIAKVSLELTTSWSVLTAASGREAIATAQRACPDAILLDVMMPEMDGPAVLKALRSQPALPQIPVLFLTAKIQKADLREFKDLGVQGVISKPFDPLRLGSLVAMCLSWPAGAEKP
jgi:two-component system alkaline phosphatase synthesis response regulator PhoP